MSWEADLSWGQKREREFMAMVPHLGLVVQTDFKEDFIDKHGAKWELKSERRTSLQTGNIAVEMVSSFKRQGAIYNAVSNGVKYIVFLFADNVYFVYDCEKIFHLARRVMRTSGTMAVRGSNAQIILLERKRLKCLQIMP